MVEKYNCVHPGKLSDGAEYPIADFNAETAEKVLSFHKSFPDYAPTPLRELSHLASYIGIKNFYVKDESFRFGLNAFKALGGSYAIGSYIGTRLGIPPDELSYDKITDPEAKEKLGDITFVTATDGNHGRGVAWTANRLSQNCVVYMPKGTARERLDNILALGADAGITDMSYDDCVRLASENAKKYGWVTVQDTAWEGYEDIPKKIMQGYTTMAHEAYSQLRGVKPTHIFLQAGVGSMAAAVCAYFASLYGKKDMPIITVLEPESADCFYRTVKANDGKLHFAEGEMHSIMAGLCCGEPNPIAWDILKCYADNFVTVPDSTAAKGMRVLGNPLPGDEQIVSGESGAGTSGFVIELMQKEELRRLRDMIKLDQDSVVLCFSTEGDTDRENYRRIVWDGAFSDRGRV